MSIDVALSHVTKYTYDRFIKLGPQTIRLRPAPHCKANVLSYSLKISPEKHFINWQQDPFSNYQARVIFPEKVNFLKIEVDLITKINVFNPFDFFLEDSAKAFPFDYSETLKKDLAPYLNISETGEIFERFVQQIATKKQQELVNFLVDVNRLINEKIKYNIRMEPGVQTPSETLTLKSGSCRDLAWLGCQVFRYLGLAARFCSGYLIQLTADVIPIQGPKGPEKDFTDLHAWIEVFLPGAGWVGLDPSSGLFAGEGHIPLSCTPTPGSAAPISGELETCESQFEFAMHINRLDEEPRSTKPYTTQQWQDIKALGTKVDKLAERHQLNLTMGGEPTFISVKNQSLDEWQTGATGEDKERVAKKMLMALKAKFGQGGLVHFSQGKWYPGEILPRWAYGCYWRKDTQPICDDTTITIEQKGQKVSTSDAQKLLTEITQRLGLSSDHIIAAHEDIPYYLWKKQFISMQDDADTLSDFERTEAQITEKVLHENKAQAAGYVLPLAVSVLKNAWVSCPWRFESNTLFLSPGSSPLGLRLPLNQLPHIADANDELIQSRTYSEMDSPLPKRQALIEKLNKNQAATYCDYPNGYIKTALCAEVRDEHLYLFLPPLNLIEHYLELIVAIEESCKALNLQVTLEGYAPPSDLRIESFKITPDPGVLEMNIQPANSWETLSQNIQTVYDEAQKLDLEAEKFLLDGKKVGTGGGNHIVLGARTPLESPFLKRADLIQSMITFWQHHPSLSYLFSSLFIGPTSQSPRIDEARHDSLYEIEIAFKQIENRQDIPYWQIDRLFRNLLVDITGNTHRSEFCIDKLYSPSGEAGRLGLLELRAFEMPPHHQMCSLQYLLIKALITIFWQQPYKANLRRFGAKLHDKYMLPTYLEDDFKSVITFVQKHGIDLKLAWFKPFVEFRFQKYGDVTVDGLNIALRAALEPWPVMGEESTASGMSRAVDSSVERLEVVVNGTLKPNQIITCNGYVLPLKQFKKNDEKHVCGVRFKAWQLYYALHPNIPVHSPLVFDVYDTRYSRSVGGCKYHVYHPGGRNYDTFPINENEAQGRRLSRFERMGHSIGDQINVKEYIPDDDFPHTLDLRRTFESAKEEQQSVEKKAKVS